MAGSRVCVLAADVSAAMDRARCLQPVYYESRKTEVSRPHLCAYRVSINVTLLGKNLSRHRVLVSVNTIV